MAGYRLPPRQKMINLVYIILIAMLAINISADTLDTYSLLERDSGKRVAIIMESNGIQRDAISGEMGAAASIIDSAVNSVTEFMDGLKEEIAKEADKKKYTSADGLKAKDNLDAVPDVMLSALRPQGHALKEKIDSLKDLMLSFAETETARENINGYLSLEATDNHTSWEKETFRSMPAIGGIAYLNSLQEAILLSEAEILKGFHELREIPGTATAPAQKIPEDSRYVLINKGQKIINADGTLDVPVVYARPAAESVIYAGYDNQVDIMSVGIDLQDIEFSVKGGRGWLDNGRYFIRPDSHADEVYLTMRSSRNHRKIIGEQRFTVNELPLPSPEIIAEKDGETVRYAGNVPIRAAGLAGFLKVEARIETPVHLSFTILGFETVLIKQEGGNVFSASSDGSFFSSEQQELLKNAEPGDKIYITSVLAKAPGDDSTVQLPPINAPVY